MFVERNKAYKLQMIGRFELSVHFQNPSKPTQTIKAGSACAESRSDRSHSLKCNRLIHEILCVHVATIGAAFSLGRSEFFCAVKINGH